LTPNPYVAPSANLDGSNSDSPIELPYLVNLPYNPIFFFLASVIGYGCIFGGPSLVALVCILWVMASFVLSAVNLTTSLKRGYSRKWITSAIELIFYSVFTYILVASGIGHVKSAREHYQRQQKTHPPAA